MVPFTRNAKSHELLLAGQSDLGRRESGNDAKRKLGRDEAGASGRDDRAVEGGAANNRYIVASGCGVQLGGGAEGGAVSTSESRRYAVMLLAKRMIFSDINIF
jgi:hypothetical protein